MIELISKHPILWLIVFILIITFIHTFLIPYLKDKWLFYKVKRNRRYYRFT